MAISENGAASGDLTIIHPLADFPVDTQIERMLRHKERELTKQLIEG